MLSKDGPELTAAVAKVEQNIFFLTAEELLIQKVLKPAATERASVRLRPEVRSAVGEPGPTMGSGTGSNYAMRIWTLHPSYLDGRGLVALWREGLLAQKVLQGGTKGYRAHPQLVRFRQSADPEAAIASYLVVVAEEAARRCYRFDADKIGRRRFAGTIDTSRGQLLYEWRHLREKLKRRAPAWQRDLGPMLSPEPHPLFDIVPGEVDLWERG